MHQREIRSDCCCLFVCFFQRKSDLRRSMTYTMWKLFLSLTIENLNSISPETRFLIKNDWNGFSTSKCTKEKLLKTSPTPTPKREKGKGKKFSLNELILCSLLTYYKVQYLEAIFCRTGRKSDWHLHILQVPNVMQSPPTPGIVKYIDQHNASHPTLAIEYIKK